jgi:hypothetical protein
MDWNATLWVIGAAIAAVSSLLTIMIQTFLTRRREGSLAAITRRSQPLPVPTDATDTGATGTDSQLSMAHELGELRVEWQLDSVDSPLAWLIVVEGAAAIGQKVPLYKHNWVKVDKQGSEPESSKLPADYQAVIVQDGKELILYDTCPCHRIRVNDTLIANNNPRGIELTYGDTLNFGTGIAFRYEPKATILFRLGDQA